MALAELRIAFDAGAVDHADDLYVYDTVAQGVDGFEAVDDGTVARFDTEGYMVIRRAWDEAAIADVRQAMSDLIAQRGAKGYQLMFEAGVRDRLDQLTAEEREASVRKIFHFDGVDPRLDAVCFDPRLMQLLERLGVGDPKLYQAMALLKGPGGREKPWHQDHAYFNTAVGERIVGAWIAVDPARPDNGCMHIMPGHHQPVIHWHRRDWQICDTDVMRMRDRVLAVPLEPGDVLLFDSLLPHGTPKNRTNLRRRALQFHYAPAAARSISTEDRLAIFGSEGKDVTC